jgi:hypothetical protein
MNNRAVRFSTFFGKNAEYFFSPNDSDPSSKSPKPQNIFQIRPKKLQNRVTGGVCEGAILKLFGWNLENILGFWGFLMGVGVIL